MKAIRVEDQSNLTSNETVWSLSEPLLSNCQMLWMTWREGAQGDAQRIVWHTDSDPDFCFARSESRVAPTAGWVIAALFLHEHSRANAPQDRAATAKGARIGAPQQDSRLRRAVVSLPVSEARAGAPPPRDIGPPGLGFVREATTINSRSAPSALPGAGTEGRRRRPDAPYIAENATFICIHPLRERRRQSNRPLVLGPVGGALCRTGRQVPRSREREAGVVAAFNRALHLFGSAR